VSLTETIGNGIRWITTELGLRRRVNADGTLAPRDWKRLGIVSGTLVIALLIWTSVHIVPPGNVAVPVFLGDPGEQIGPGIHVTLPFTTTRNMSVRTETYTMSANPTEGRSGDDSIKVLGSDGGSANIDATVLYQLDRDRASEVYRTVGTSLVAKIIRPSARSCIRSEFTDFAMVDAATTSWHDVEDQVAACMTEKLEPRGIDLQDFQLREVKLSDQLQRAVDLKVAADQNAKQQIFNIQAAQRQADAKRAEAAGTSDSQAILNCGFEQGERDGVTTFVPPAGCPYGGLTQEYLTLLYIQALQGIIASGQASTVILPPGGATGELLELQIPTTPRVVPDTSDNGGSTTTTTTGR
jgi:regulator of protease activity HflC (stomatin/prohibitin superfamily)